ncbi:MAG: asparagine synthase-related protein, partial [Candidatus Sumerlaeota bacterium]
EMNMVAEGYNASKCIHINNKEVGATMPIAGTIYRILWEGQSPKAGFAVPLRHWLRKELKPMMQDLLSPTSTCAHGFFDDAFVQSLIRDHLSGRWNFERQLWALMVFQLWYRAQKQ